MKTFKEWIEENHPEYFEENFWKKLAIGGALAGSTLGGGMGGAYMLGKQMGQNQTQQQTQQQTQDQQRQPTHPLGPYYAKQRERQREEMKNKSDQLKAKGIKSGKFVHGKLVEPEGYTAPRKGNREISNKSTTSPDAKKFLKGTSYLDGDEE